MAKSAGGLVAKGKGQPTKQTTKTTMKPSTKQTKPKSEEKPSFETVRTYQDLINANVAYLQGHLDDTPYHHGKVDEETIPLLGDLVKLNRRGFVSVEGQPGVHELGFVKETWPCGNGLGKVCGNWWYEIDKKPYIVGLMQKVHFPQFKKFMRSHSYSYHYMIEGSDVSTFPTDQFNLTRERVHKYKEALKRVPWTDYTNVWFGEGSRIRDFPADMQKMINKEAFCVLIAGNTYNEGSTEKLLLDFYKSLA